MYVCMYVLEFDMSSSGTARQNGQGLCGQGLSEKAFEVYLYSIAIQYSKTYRETDRQRDWEAERQRQRERDRGPERQRYIHTDIQTRHTET